LILGSGAQTRGRPLIVRIRMLAMPLLTEKMFGS
jgi:hypothetical protein